jgi:hypothetical protein
MSILTNRIYYIDTEDRLSGTPSNFTYQLEMPANSRFDTACVLSMTIPRSYYLIREGQNRLTLTIDGVASSITIPKGNYNVLNFITTMTTLMNAISPGFSMTFVGITGKYLYRYTGSASALSFTLENPSRLGHQMGFSEVSVSNFIDGILNSTNVVDFISTSTLFLHSDLVSDQSSILQEVYSDNSIPFSNLVYSCRDASMYSKVLSTNTTSTFRFSLTDEHDLEVDLNGHEILITLLLYRKENLTELIKKALLLLQK